MKTIILGKSSFLTKNLKKNIKDLEIFSARQKADIPKIIKEIEKFKKFNLIFNNFYPSNKLNSINDNLYKNFYDQSLNFNWEFLNLINKKKLIKLYIQAVAQFIILYQTTRIMWMGLIVNSIHLLN